MIKMTNKIAAAMLNQLGGRGFIVMTGAKDFFMCNDFFRFKIGKNAAGINTVTLGLRDDDTYYMKFERVSVSKKTFEVKKILKKEYDGIYCDQLGEFFREATELETKVPRVCRINA